MNIKLLPYIKEEGYCCLWAWLEAHRAVHTSKLEVELKGIIKLRALQYQRRAHRKGQTRCEDCKGCLKKPLIRKTP